MKKLDATKVEILRRAFLDVVQEIRQSFQDADIRGFEVSLEASGRSFNGEAKLTTSVSCNEYGAEPVKSPDLNNSFTEALRRKGFDLANEALALPAPGTELEDEIAF